MGEDQRPVYVTLASETDDPQVTVISSLCMNCHEMVRTGRGRGGGESIVGESREGGRGKECEGRK